MGEYAIRKSDQAEIKIGTCEEMMYLRLEDRDKVETRSDSSFGWFWRLPFPDEDDVPIGEYDPPCRGIRLYKQNRTSIGLYCEDFTDTTTADDPGNIQLTHESGLLLNVRCYHGVKLPAETQEYRPFWNGKTSSFELIYLRTDGERVWPIVRCRHCRQMWRYTWEDVLPYLQGEMKDRLKKYAAVE